MAPSASSQLFAAEDLYALPASESCDLYPDEAPVEIPLPALGAILAGKYRIDRVLGEGGMGIVYEAFHLRLQHRVAIKMLLPLVLTDPDFVTRFEREARAAARLESPFVAKVLDVDTSPEGLPYMVIEYLEGHDLAEELSARGRLPIAEAVALVIEACAPIAEAHALGIVHRDLKPGNLFLARHGGKRCVKLIDFGVSKVLTDDAKKITSSLQGVGTPHYMSPEQVRDASDVDQRSDIWSLGIILYELLTGTTPFNGSVSSVIAAIVADPVPPPRTLRPELPEALERVIMCALEKDLEKRHPDVRALTLALAPFAVEEELVPASSVSGSLAAPSTTQALAFCATTPSVSRSSTTPVNALRHRRGRRGTRRSTPAEPKTLGAWGDHVPGLPPAKSRWPWLVVPTTLVLVLGGFWLAGSAFRAAPSAAAPPMSVQIAPSAVDVPPPPPPVLPQIAAVSHASPPSPLASPMSTSSGPAPMVPVKARPPSSPHAPVLTNPLTL